MAKFEDYQGFLKKIDQQISNLTGGSGLGASDFGDSVFTYDAYEDGRTAKDVAEEILENDSIGSAWLESERG
jgi:hypothetical protein